MLYLEMQDLLEEKVIDLAEQAAGSEPYKDVVEMIENQVGVEIYDMMLFTLTIKWVKKFMLS